METAYFGLRYLDANNQTVRDFPARENIVDKAFVGSKTRCGPMILPLYQRLLTWGSIGISRGVTKGLGVKICFMYLRRTAAEDINHNQSVSLITVTGRGRGHHVCLLAPALCCLGRCAVQSLTQPGILYFILMI